MSALLRRLYWFCWRVRGGWRCRVGLHRLRGYQGGGDGKTVAPYDPRARPVYGTWRRCEWCGATWIPGDDGGVLYVWVRKPSRVAVGPSGGGSSHG